MIIPKFKFQKRVLEQMRGKVEAFNFEVGVLNNKMHKGAIPREVKGLRKFAGGSARYAGKKNTQESISQISQSLRRKTGKNFYTLPFRNPNNKEILRVVKLVLDLAINEKGTIKMLTNAIQAIVRNPILRGDYGRNNLFTQKVKGFNRLMIDTGQFFNNIKARVFKRN